MNPVYKLRLQCRACDAMMPIKPTRLNRTALAEDIGVEFEKTCPKCEATQQYHIKSVIAVTRLPMVLFILVLGITLTIMLTRQYAFTAPGILFGFTIIPIVLSLGFTGIMLRTLHAITKDFNHNRRERGKWD